MNRSKAPSFAPDWAMKRRACSVISMKSRPRVSTTSVAVAIRSGATLVIVDKGAPTTLSRCWRLRPFQNVLLQSHDHLDQTAPDLFDEAHHLVEVGIVGQLQARF